MPDAATRLQEFRALIAEMRATLIHCDFDTGGRNDDRDNNDDDVGEDGERERVLRLLEDVMRKVKHLAEKDAAGFGRHGLSPRSTLW